jgi:hypothetical protein
MLRRDFIRNLGGLTASGLLLPGLDIAGSRALAQGSAPKRFVVIMGALGMQMRRWVTGTPGDYQLGEALQALAPHRQDLAVMRGLQLRKPTHSSSSGCFLTGDSLGNDTAKHATIDQVIARRTPPSVALPSGEILRSLQAGVGVRKSGSRATLIYEAKGTPIAPENDPAALFDRIFGGGPISEGGAGADTLQRRLDLKQSILDVHRAELSAITAHAGIEDRERLELHTDAIRALESDLADLRSGGTPTAECSAPNRYAAGGVFDGNNFGRIAEAHCDIIGRAFACDATRVATLQLLFDTGSGVNVNFLESKAPGISDKAIHDEMHKAGQSARAIEEWYVSVLGYLMDLLNVEDPFDPAGGRILDNTVILFGSNLSFPAHGGGPNYGRFAPGEQDTHDHPTLLAGGAGGYFRTGQFLDFRKSGLFYGENDDKYDGSSGHAFHNKLLVSLLNAFGENVSTYGDPDYCQGGALDGGLLR